MAVHDAQAGCRPESGANYGDGGDRGAAEQRHPAHPARRGGTDPAGEHFGVRGQDPGKGASAGFVGGRFGRSRSQPEHRLPVVWSRRFRVMTRSFGDRAGHRCAGLKDVEEATQVAPGSGQAEPEGDRRMPRIAAASGELTCPGTPRASAS